MPGIWLSSASSSREASAKANAERARRFYDDACKAVDLAPAEAGDKPGPPPRRC